MKSIKFKTIIFSIILVISTLFVVNFVSAEKPKKTTTKFDGIKLQVAIPVPSCKGINSDNLVCKNDQITEVKDLPSYVVAIFRFGVVLIASFLVVLMVVGGVIYMTSAGNKGRADKGLGYIKNAAYALIAVIFSYFILNTINPNLTNLSINGVGNITGKKLCAEITTKDLCGKKTNTCIWLDKKEACVSGSVQCESISTETDCNLLGNSCLWIQQTDLKGSCVTPRPKTAGDCELLKTLNGCQTGSGCTWEYGCNLKKSNLVLLNVGPNPCTKYKYDSTCKSNISCKWYTKGSCMKSIDAYNIDCSNRQETDCTKRSACYWNNSEGVKRCLKSPPIDAKCSSHDDCSISQYCDNDTKSCQLRIGQNKPCDGKSIGKSLIDNRVCMSGYYCDDLLTGSGTNNCINCIFNEKSNAAKAWCAK